MLLGTRWLNGRCRQISQYVLFTNFLSAPTASLHSLVFFYLNVFLIPHLPYFAVFQIRSYIRHPFLTLSSHSNSLLRYASTFPASSFIPHFLMEPALLWCRESILDPSPKIPTGLRVLPERCENGNDFAANAYLVPGRKLWPESVHSKWLGIACALNTLTFLFLLLYFCLRFLYSYSVLLLPFWTFILLCHSIYDMYAHMPYPQYTA